MLARIAKHTGLKPKTCSLDQCDVAIGDEYSPNRRRDRAGDTRLSPLDMRMLEPRISPEPNLGESIEWLGV
jgi:hypothetical protein